MTTILLIEDEDKKANIILEHIKLKFPHALITRAASQAEAIPKLYNDKFDLILFDLLLPRQSINDHPVNAASDIRLAITEGPNVGALSIGLSQFDGLVDEERKAFVEAGIFLIPFDGSTSNWKSSLDVCFQRLQQKQAFDFLIICALPKERDGFHYADCDLGEAGSIMGLNCLKIRIGDAYGVCLLLPRMGLVDATAVTTRAIDIFSPKLVAVSGICAGFSSEVEMGAVVACDLTWEHQNGKWKEDGFKSRQYQSSICTGLQTMLKILVDDKTFRTASRKKLNATSDHKNAKDNVGLMVSGSAVISNGTVINSIQTQHDKLLGLDMEMYGVFRACEIAQQSQKFFGIKVVVDLADDAKGDILHEYGCRLSAKYVTEAVRRFFN